jgi:hypothetical protein
MKKQSLKHYLVRKTEDYYIEVEAFSKEEALDVADRIDWGRWEFSDATMEAERLPSPSLGDGPFVVKQCITCRAPFNYLKRHSHRAVNCPLHRNVNQHTVKK